MTQPITFENMFGASATPNIEIQIVPDLPRCCDCGEELQPAFDWSTAPPIEYTAVPPTDYRPMPLPPRLFEPIGDAP